MSKARVFISYKRQDKAKAQALARALEQDGVDVFWDADIRGGESWRTVLERELTAATSVVVLWSAAAQSSDWVVNEAMRAKDAKKLLPLYIEDGLGPVFGFDAVQHRPLLNWDGDRNDPQYRDLLADIAAMVGQAPPAPPPPVGKPPSRTPVYAIAGIGVAAVGVAAVLMIPGGPPDEEGPQTPDLPPPPEGRVRFAPGRFTMGSALEGRQAGLSLCRATAPQPDTECFTAMYEREAPQREVELTAFDLQATEVTNRALADGFGAWTDVTVTTVGRGDEAEQVLIAGGERLLYVQRSSGLELDGAGPRLVVKDGWADRPATGVTWMGARRYCRDIGADLPTEAQWERAARGAPPRRFPWGQTPPRCDGVVYGRADGLPCAAMPAEPRAAADGGQDVTPDGIKNLAGNVGEWVLDGFIAPYPACGDCVDPVVEEVGEQRLRVVRGGWFNLLPDALRGTSRSRMPEDQGDITVGLRCAFSVPS